MKNYLLRISWDGYSRLIIAAFLFLQIFRWPVMPQFMDIYYHLLTGWGFLRAGGYTGWDFWQYAPVGRIHIYPPLFHIVLAILSKLGTDPIIAAKVFEAVAPAGFLAVLWYFIRKNFSAQLAFFVILASCSSFAFFVSLGRHIPATLAFIFGFLALDKLFNNKLLQSFLLLALCFYTHIGASWMFALGFVFFGLLNNEFRRRSFIVFIFTFILSLPILIWQLTGLKFISTLGFMLSEKNIIQLKLIDYILAMFGLIAVFKIQVKYRLFAALALASLVFLPYPYRFFSTEGGLAIIFLTGIFLSCLYERIKGKELRMVFLLFFAAYFLFLSPTLSLNRLARDKAKPAYGLKFPDSAFTGMLSVKASEIIWFGQEYQYCADIIKKNSGENEIIYASNKLAGMILASISGRATANALLPEIGACTKFNPYLTSKVIIFTKADKPDFINRIIERYGLVRIGENKIFLAYINPLCQARIKPDKPFVTFGGIFMVFLAFLVLFLWPARENKYLT